MSARDRQLKLEFFEQLEFIFEECLSFDEIQDLLAWEEKNLDGLTCTTDWPGWKKHMARAEEEFKTRRRA